MGTYTFVNARQKVKEKEAGNFVLTCYINMVQIWQRHNLAKSLIVTRNGDIVIGSKQVELFGKVSLTRTLYRKNEAIGGERERERENFIKDGNRRHKQARVLESIRRYCST